jgi:hypothetical protein
LGAVIPKRKPHENGVMVEHDGKPTSWHWSATPSEARMRYADVVERVTEANAPGTTRIQLVELGQVVKETTLDRARD